MGERYFANTDSTCKPTFYFATDAFIPSVLESVAASGLDSRVARLLISYFGWLETVAGSTRIENNSQGHFSHNSSFHFLLHYTLALSGGLVNIKRKTTKCRQFVNGNVGKMRILH